MRFALELNGPPRHYESDDYFVGVWTAAGIPTEQAEELAGSPLTLVFALMIRDFGLEAIFADAHATRGLRKYLLANRDLVHQWLAEYAKPPKSKSKRGPRPGSKGKYLGDLAVERRAQGLTLGQIAKELYGKASMRNLVSAHLAQAKKKKDNLKSSPAFGDNILTIKFLPPARITPA
jgi:hypothetical protein